MRSVITTAILLAFVHGLEAAPLYEETFEKGSQTALRSYDRKWRYLPEKISDQVIQSFSIQSGANGAPAGSSRHLAIHPVAITPPGRLSVQYSPWQNEHSAELSNTHHNQFSFDIYIGDSGVERPLLVINYLMNAGLDQVGIAFRNDGSLLIAPRRNAELSLIAVSTETGKLARQQWHRVVLSLSIPEGGSKYTPRLKVHPLNQGETGEPLAIYSGDEQTPIESAVSSFYGFRITVDSPEPSEAPASFGLDNITIDSSGAAY